MNSEINAGVPAVDGLDAEMRAFVATLRRAPTARTGADFTQTVMAAVRAERARPRFTPWSFLFSSRMAAAVPIAAGLALLLALGSVFLRSAPTVSLGRLVACQRADGTFTGSSAAPYVQAFAVTALAGDSSVAAGALDSAVGALVRDQTAEGGWGNDALSARNVAALRRASEAGAAGAREAYRKGRRYLRMHGLLESSDADLVREAKAVQARLDPTADRGLLYSVALCAVH